MIFTNDDIEDTEKKGPHLLEEGWCDSIGARINYVNPSPKSGVTVMQGLMEVNLDWSSLKSVEKTMSTTLVFAVASLHRLSLVRVVSFSPKACTLSDS